MLFVSGGHHSGRRFCVVSLCFLPKQSTCLKSRRKFGELRRKTTKWPPRSVFGNKMSYRFFFFTKSKAITISFKNTSVCKITQKSQVRVTWDRYLIKHFQCCIKSPGASPGLECDCYKHFLMSGIVRRSVEVGGNRKLGQLGNILGLVTNIRQYFTVVSRNSQWSLQRGSDSRGILSENEQDQWLLTSLKQFSY